VPSSNRAIVPTLTITGSIVRKRVMRDAFGCRALLSERRS
jgi:hypothetical protein